MMGDAVVPLMLSLRGSTDWTGEVVACHREHVRCLQQNNLDPAAPRNFGLSAARGHFVAFLDQHDLWHPQELETLSVSRYPG